MHNPIRMQFSFWLLSPSPMSNPNLQKGKKFVGNKGIYKKMEILFCLAVAEKRFWRLVFAEWERSVVGVSGGSVFFVRFMVNGWGVGCWLLRAWNPGWETARTAKETTTPTTPRVVKREKREFLIVVF